jgi:hypothetical protein
MKIFIGLCATSDANNPNLTPIQHTRMAGAHSGTNILVHPFPDELGTDLVYGLKNPPRWPPNGES